MNFAMYVETNAVNISISNQTQRVYIFFFSKDVGAYFYWI